MSDRLTPLRSTWLPFEPLADIAPPYQPDGHGTNYGLASVLPERLARQWYRARKSGRITARTADEICIALGYHPVEVWGDEWWLAD